MIPKRSENMTQYASSLRMRLLYLIFIMVGVAVAATGVSIGLLYDAAFKEEQARLVVTCPQGLYHILC